MRHDRKGADAHPASLPAPCLTSPDSENERQRVELRPVGAQRIGRGYGRLPLVQGRRNCNGSHQIGIGGGLRSEAAGRTRPASAVPSHSLPWRARTPRQAARGDRSQLSRSRQPSMSPITRTRMAHRSA